MTPDLEPLTSWARLEVQRMIDATFKEYDIKQDARHRENGQKLDKLIWLIIVTLLTAVGGLTTNILTHLAK